MTPEKSEGTSFGVRVQQSIRGSRRLYFADFEFFRRQWDVPWRRDSVSSFSDSDKAVVTDSNPQLTVSSPPPKESSGGKFLFFESRGPAVLGFPNNLPPYFSFVNVKRR